MQHICIALVIMAYMQRTQPSIQHMNALHRHGGWYLLNTPGLVRHSHGSGCTIAASVELRTCYVPAAYLEHEDKALLLLIAVSAHDQLIQR